MIYTVLICFVVGLTIGLPIVLTLIGATIMPGVINPDGHLCSCRFHDHSGPIVPGV